MNFSISFIICSFDGIHIGEACRLFLYIISCYYVLELAVNLVICINYQLGQFVKMFTVNYVLYILHFSRRLSMDGLAELSTQTQESHTSTFLATIAWYKDIEMQGSFETFSYK